jgi:glycosyltransferase involved in cell wall biosynthesis
MTTLAIVVPAYNEAEVLPAFHARLLAVLGAMPASPRILYVDDGSSDATWATIAGLAAADARVTGLRLSRNFGKEAAMTAGLDRVDADATVIIDADLQDPPELIPQLLERFHAGFDVVYATRNARDGESALKRLTSAAFYRVMEKMSDTAVPRDTGDFRLLSRRAVDALGKLRERQRFMKGLFAWIGYRQTSVLYHRDAREAGTTKWNYWRLWNFALEGITSFSTAPLRIATWMGITAASFAFIYGVFVLLKALLEGDRVPGYPTLMVVILFLGGAQLLALGVIGEYIGRTYAESKGRPLYFVEETATASRDGNVDGPAQR